MSGSSHGWGGGLFLICLLLLGGCGKPTPESKVRRWASQVMVDVEAGEAPTVDVAQGRVPAQMPVAKAPKPDGCSLIVERACRGLGPYTDECAEARGVVPREPTAAWHNACAGLVDEYESYLTGDGRGRGPHPCKTRMVKKCGLHGLRSHECKEAKSESARLGRSGRRDACLGDLLAWELFQVAESVAP